MKTQPLPRIIASTIDMLVVVIKGEYDETL